MTSTTRPTTRRPMIIGNWKMNLGGRDGLTRARRLLDQATPDSGSAQLVVLPPFTGLALLQQASGPGRGLEYGAQDMSPNDDGAFTGDISAAMLANLGCSYVLAGHSERREHHHEDDLTVNAKVRTALQHDLIPILCVGEGLDVRRTGNHVSHALAQLDAGLNGLSADQVARVVVAYEPVWAIGTGEVATPEDAQDVCAAIRYRVGEVYGQHVADQVRVLYGGSVKATTSAAITAKLDIDGALVGGASLDPDELMAIWQAACPQPAAGSPTVQHRTSTQITQKGQTHDSTRA